MNFNLFRKIVSAFLLCLAVESLVFAEPSAPSAANDPVEVRFICVAPSPYTDRHDSLRAGFGIFILLQQAIAKHNLNISTTYYDGSTFYDDGDKIRKVLHGPQVILLGGDTWAQGPTYYMRRFFEVGPTDLTGVSASAWATSGGAQTGGEVVVSTTLRSLMGMGAKTFTLGQKLMVFTTDERLSPQKPGAFSLLDLWYMDQFARTIAVEALFGNDRTKAKKLAKELGTNPYYYKINFPPSPEKLSEYVDLQRKLNAAADPKSPEYQELRSMLANDAPKTSK